MLVKDIMTGNPEVIDVELSTISDAMSKMRSTDIHQIPAVSGKKYVGMLNYREILRKRSMQLSARVDTFLINTPKLSPEDDIREVIRLIVHTGLSAFPVLDKSRIVGIISRSDIIQHLDEFEEAKNIRNRQIMSSAPLTALGDDNIQSAADKMRGLDETEIPIVDSDNKLVGILRLDEVAADTFRREKQGIRGGHMAFGNVGGSMVDVAGDRGGDKSKVDIKCSSLMDNPRWVFGHEPITKTAEIIMAQRLHIVPVVNDDLQIEGIVGISDIIDSLDTGEEKEGLLIQVTGLDPDDQDLYEITYAMASKFIVRFSKITGISHGKLNIQVIKYHTEGVMKYSVRTKIIAEPLTMSLDHHDWNYGKCLSFIFETYEPRLRKWKTK
ncbi:hypothetical protein IX51_08760 [uncultured archaeon]|nr:hypothetical protein IX51_08760 [uncultured archaeon]